MFVYVILVPFQMVVPRRNMQAQDDFLPTYSAADAQAYLQKHPDDEKDLPYYSREE